ncbi:glycosyltransferase [Flavobacterium sp. LMO8]|uniref:glycosyltransferase family 2 protein n=1 Tax=Flavobacterium sp. LMO8 TaxID=2654244 RepID=UPI001290E1F4|nr:glycosyltransferase family 2 protein [Flavobacterium sp. LMO8]MQP24996.1 glycosyltransferase [Flavobacterium sp. LMO8]
MSTTPFFSIVTASYNSEKTISDTIDSVLNLDFQDFEYIIIDGNSSDSTLKIIQSFVPKFEAKGIPYKFISEKDKGIYDAWNKGIQLSSGQWISFLGSDDMYIEDALINYSNEINKSGSKTNYISSQVEIIDEKHQFIRVIGKPFKWVNVVRNMNIAQVGSFHKKELFEKVGNFSTAYKIVGDLDFYIRCKETIEPAFFNEITAKMQNGGVSNQIYKALKEALVVKLKYGYNSRFISYFDFYFSLLKCYIKLILKK